MARQIVNKSSLGRVAGMADLLKDLERRKLTVEQAYAIKEICNDAAEPVQKLARRNIDALPFSARAKEILKAQVIRGRGPKKFPNAIVALYQFSKEAKAYNPHGETILNPYWIEEGTEERQTGKSGGPVRRTGKINAVAFFGPAVKDARPEVRALLAAGLKSILIEGKEPK